MCSCWAWRCRFWATCPPIGPEYVERAIELNGTAVATNLALFNWGGRGHTTRRRWARNPPRLPPPIRWHPRYEHRAGVHRKPVSTDAPLSTVPGCVPTPPVQYQSQRYASRFDAVDEVAALDQAELTEAVPPCICTS